MLEFQAEKDYHPFKFCFTDKEDSVRESRIRHSMVNIVSANHVKVDEDTKKIFEKICPILNKKVGTYHTREIIRKLLILYDELYAYELENFRIQLQKVIFILKY